MNSVKVGHVVLLAGGTVALYLLLRRLAHSQSARAASSSHQRIPHFQDRLRSPSLRQQQDDGTNGTVELRDATSRDEDDNNTSGGGEKMSDDGGSNTSDTPPRAEYPLHILHENPEAIVDIVAVHGLGANPDYAWVWLPKHNPPGRPGYPDKPFNWLKELLPAKLPCRVMAFNYDSKWFLDAPQQRVSSISNRLLDSLRNSRDMEIGRPLIFIGHSFGGNVIEQAIVSASRQSSEYLYIAKSTVGVVFLGTPHRGSRAAAWGRYIASLAPPGFVTEDRLLKALEEQSDSLADRLQDFSRWLMLESVPVVCCFEQRVTDYSRRIGVAGLIKDLVVPESSACIDGQHKIALDTDHLKINKFYGPDDSSFKLVYPEIERMARRRPKAIPTNLRECLQKMRVTNPADVLSEVQTQKGERVEHTCEWILNRWEFSAWEANEHPQLLRLIGSPGIGKTMMSTFLVEVLRGKAERPPGKVFAYFFCDDKDQDRKTPTAILRSLVWQLLQQRNELFQHVQPDFEKHADDRVYEDLFDNFSALWRIFRDMLRDERAGEVFILVDALDECEISARDVLLRSIEKLFRSSPTAGMGKFKFLVTCRPEINDIERELKSVGVPLIMNSANINNDLSEYIDIKVDGLDYPEQLKVEVKNALKREADGTFLWVSLMVADLRNGNLFMHEVKDKLRSLPRGLDNTYTAILDRIPPHRQEVAQFVLRCIVAARRPLRKIEIQAAFATSKTGSILPHQELAVYADICSACSSILYVSDASNDYATITFCHQSVKDFLLRNVSDTDRRWYHTGGDEANLLIFTACWAYLRADEFNRGSLVVCRMGSPGMEFLAAREVSLHLQRHVQEYPFLKYSSDEWENHAIASYPALLRRLHQLEINPTEASTLCDAWLLRAAREGQEVVVKLLLEKGADIEAKNIHGRTPLSWAAVNEYEVVVKLLLEKGADIETKNIRGMTPLLEAVRYGHEAIVKLLVEKGADIEAKDIHGRMPLLEAAVKGHEAIVKLLLEKGANIEAKGSGGRTPLWRAAANGHEVIVKLLLEKGADIETKDILGMTPLLAAAANGHEANVKLLVEKGADIEAKDTRGITPLMLADANGHEAIVKLLLEKGAANGQEAIV